MNLRILKKLSKRAAPLLPLLGDHREQFPAERGANYMSTLILDRKHFERMRSLNPDCLFERDMKWPARDGRGWIRATPPAHPWPGTVMVGSMVGYEEPEWDEETAWCALVALVMAHFTDWDTAAATDEPPVPTRDLSTPSLIFEAARDMAAELACERGMREARARLGGLLLGERAA
ncbi:MAG: hypothetical protein KDJ44_09215 [Rhodoblastus sp.]|nr:hypothetical protein [Rhodoblastus sp.]